MFKAPLSQYLVPFDQTFSLADAATKPAMYDTAYHLKANSKPNTVTLKISGLTLGKGIIALAFTD